MGNRAAVVFTNKSASPTEISPAVYLHWNGGPESIYAFLQELRRRRCTGDVSYTSARFVHVVADFFDQEEVTACSLGIEPPPAEISTEGLASLANQADDNGVFVISPGEKDWNVRRFVLCMDHKVREMKKREVAAEKKAALNHPYNANPDDSIASAFIKMRPKIG